MKLDQNLIILLIGSIFLVFFGGKFFGNMFHLIWKSFFNKSHTRDHNLDEMIKKQEQILRKGYSTQKPINKSHEGSASKNITQTEARYLNEGHKSKIEGFKKILSLLDHLKWGEGEIYNEIRKQLKLILNQDVDLLEVSQTITKSFREDYFLKLKDERLPNYLELEKAIISKVFLKLIYLEAKFEKGSFLSKFAKSNKTKELSAIWAIKFYFLKKMGQKEEELFSEIVKNNDKTNRFNEISSIELEILIDKIVIAADHSTFVSVESIIRDLKKYIEIFLNLESIPPLKNKKDLSGAYSILKVKKDSSMEEIKKSYKKLVKIKHPDKFSKKNLPESAQKIITENFSIIQSAYDLLKDQEKK